MSAMAGGGAESVGATGAEETDAGFGCKDVNMFRSLIARGAVG
jgi:hypothetical protein